MPPIFGLDRCGNIRTRNIGWFRIPIQLIFWENESNAPTENMKNFLVIDFEATCSSDRSIPREEMEIIEIGAVMVCHHKLEPLDEFQAFVRPLRNPELTSYCRELTSISQRQVDSAATFPEVIERLSAWVRNRAAFVFCSWGDYDRRQLRQDCRWHQVEYPFDKEHINLKQSFAKIHGRKKQGVKSALGSVGLSFDGCHHRGIDDARNISRLLPFIFGGGSAIEAEA